jgi:hypothetical protein
VPTSVSVYTEAEVARSDHQNLAQLAEKIVLARATLVRLICIAFMVISATIPSLWSARLTFAAAGLWLRHSGSIGCFEVANDSISSLALASSKFAPLLG